MNQTSIKECLEGLVGLRKSVDTKLPVPAPEFQSPESGIFLNGIHSLITVENIWSTIQEGGVISRPDDWGADQIFNNYLQERLSDAVVRLANAIYVDKQLNQYAKTQLADTKLYDGSANIHDTIEKHDRFVGFRFRVKASDVSTILRRVSTQFEQNNSNLKLYLYKSGEPQPLKVWEIDYTKQYYAQWHELEQTDIPALVGGHHYYVGYYEEDLSGRAINKDVKFQKPPCTCEPVNYQNWKKWSKHLAIQSFYVDSTNVDPDRELWDENSENIVDGFTWGLNLVINMACDLTGVLCANKQLLSGALATQAAVMILEDMANTGRDNQQSKTLSQKAFYALDNKENKAIGLYGQLRKEIEVINLDLGGMNTECMPCQNKGIVFGTVY